MHDNNTNRFRQTISVAVAALVVLSMGTGVATAAGNTDLSVTLETETLASGQTTTVSVVLDSTNGGVGSGQLQVSLTDPSVAEITDITVGSSPAFKSDPIFAQDDSSVQASYIGDTTSQTGPVTVAEVTIEATAEGSTGIEISGPPDIADGALTFGDQSGQSYTIDNIGSATLTVEAANQPPSADAGDDQTVTADDPVTLDGSDSSDPNPGDTLSYSWTVTDDAGTEVSLNDPSAAQPTFTAPDVGSETTLEFELEVSDGDLSDTDTVSVTVQPPEAANFQVSNLQAPATATQGESIDVSATVENTGGQSATKAVEFRVDANGDGLGDSGDVVLSQDVPLDAGASTTVEFEDVDTSALAAGTYTHGVVTPDDSATASIEIEEAEQPEAPTTGVSLSPSEQTVGVGDSVTYDVVVDSAAGGVGSIDLTVSTDDASIAEISSIEAAGEAAYVESTVLSDGTSATLDAVGLDTAQSGPVTVATVTVTGVSADGTSVASTDLSIDVESLGTEGAVDYEVTGTSGATVTVQPAEFLVSDLDAPDGVVRGEPVTVTADVTNDGSITTTKTVQFRFDLNGDGTLSEGETVATTQLKLDPGETQEVTLTAVVPEDTPLGEYDHGVFTVDDSQSATIDVTLAKLDSQYDGPPQDLDGDGLYEDVNGNGEVNLNDVQALFVNRDSAVIQENGALFDFNGNGEFNNVDIQKFFTTISQSN
jgi:hypothetical protein